MPTAAPEANSRLDGLDGLCGIAALCVLGYHLHTIYGGLPLFRHSYLAVDFFFMLSGYVMARSYEPAFARGLGIGQFVIKRFARLFLPMAVGATLGLAFFASQGQFEPLRYFATLLFVPDPLLRDPYILNRPTWSIFFELAANAVHAAVLWRCKTPVVVALALLAAGLLLVAALPYEHIALGNHREDFLGGFARVGFAYCLGIALYRSRLVLPGSV